MKTVQEARIWGAGYLKEKAVENPFLEAELLLAHALSFNKTDLIKHRTAEIEPEKIIHFKTLIERRGERYPFHYLTGKREFLEWDFQITPGVFIPRPETEVLVLLADEFLTQAGIERPRILDIGCGSGVILISLLLLNPNASGVGIDICSKAVELTRANSLRLGTQERSEILNQSLEVIDTQFDLIICNPPYVEENSPHISPETLYEPSRALYSGSDGLDFIRRMLPRAKNLLTDRGGIFLEIGYNQGETVKQLLAENGFQDPTLYQDISGIYRVAGGKKLGKNLSKVD